MFEDSIFSQEKTEKEGNVLCLKVKATSFHQKEKLSESDLEQLKVWLLSSQLVEISQDATCGPCKPNVNNLPFRQRITNAEEVISKLDETAARLGILEKLSNELDTAAIIADERCKTFDQQSLSVNNDMCKHRGKSTRKQNQ